MVAAGEERWGQQSGLVMLLPHGYDGQVWLASLQQDPWAQPHGCRGLKLMWPTSCTHKQGLSEVLACSCHARASDPFLSHKFTDRGLQAAVKPHWHLPHTVRSRCRAKTAAPPLEGMSLQSAMLLPSSHS